MKKFISTCLLSFAALLALPDTSVADGFCYGYYSPSVAYYAPPVYYSPPVYYAPPVAYYAPAPYYGVYGGYGAYGGYSRVRVSYHPHHAVYRSHYRTIQRYPW